MVVTKRSGTSIITIDESCVTKVYLDRFHDVDNEYQILSWLSRLEITTKPISFDDNKNEIVYKYIEGHPITCNDLSNMIVVEKLSKVLSILNNPVTDSELDSVLRYNKCIIINWCFITTRRASEFYFGPCRKDLLQGLREIIVELSNDSKNIIHGDLHPGNILVSYNDLHLIDLELLTYGPPEYDYGRIIGWLIIRCDAIHYFHIKSDFIIPTEDIFKKIIENFKQFTINCDWNLIIKYSVYTICFIIESSTFPFSTTKIKNIARGEYYPICSEILTNRRNSMTETALRYIL